MRTLEQRLKDEYAETRAALAGATNHPGFQINTHTVRELADTLDGIVFATSLLRDDRLLDAGASDGAKLREALAALRHAKDAAACSNTTGFFNGVNRAHYAVAAIIEGKP